MRTWRRVAARRFIAVTSALVLTLTVAEAVGGSAYAAPGWEPDPNTAAPYGSLVFYDAAGNRVSSGTDTSNPFAYVVATTVNPTGSANASDYVAFYAPDHTQPTSSWAGIQVSNNTQFNPSSDLPSGTPPDLVRYAPDFPIAATPGPTITSWLSSTSALDNTDGYANIIQVRLYLSGQGSSYWATDIGYNTTTAPIIIDDTTIPPDGWAVIYPRVSSGSSITLTTSASDGQMSIGYPITLTAVSEFPAGRSGVVQFYDGTTVLADVAASGALELFRYTPGPGKHNYSASFVPDPGSPDVAGSISSGVPVAVLPIQTTISLTARSSNTSPDPSNAFTATVSAADGSLAGVQGSVQFYDGSTSLGPPVPSAVTGAGTSQSPGVGVAQLSLALPNGAHSITASFTPTNSTYAESTSSVIEVLTPSPLEVQSPATKTFNAEFAPTGINPGSLTITTPYTPMNPLILPPLNLSSDGTYLETPSSGSPGDATELQIDVTSSLDPAYAWTVSISASPFSGPSGAVIPASGLGLTAGRLINNSGSSAYPGIVMFRDIPALNPSSQHASGSGPGLGSTPQVFAKSSASVGSAELGGTLTVFAPTSTPAGSYTGTIDVLVF